MSGLYHLSPKKSRRLNNLLARAQRELGLNRRPTLTELEQHGYIKRVEND